MLNRLISKPKLQFVSRVPGISDLYPIKPASEFKFSWIKSVMTQYKRAKELAPYPNHIGRCPGIFDLLKIGYIVPIPFDLLMIIRPDAETLFRWEVGNESLLSVLGNEVVQPHLPIGDHRPPGFLDQVIKINSPWRIIAPKGVQLLVNPIPYPDIHFFRGVSGLWDVSNSPQLNIQMWFTDQPGEYLIKAGTPMMHIIPLTDKKLDLVIRDANDNDYRWLEKESFATNHSFDPGSIQKNTKILFDKHYHDR